MDDTAPLPPLEHGAQIGRWRLDAPVGSGGLAEVWRATAEDAPRPVALKILREPDRSGAHRARFIREGRLLTRLDHPGLPRCHEVIETPRPALVLDLLGGDTLSSEIRGSGPLTPERAERVATSLLRVLEYLHQHGIIHRDVKSSNIFMADDRRVLLLDLGLAAAPADPLTTTLGDVMGTYAYMAPEQIAGAEVDHRSDLYSLGVTLYEALAGSRPFHARGAAGYLRAHRDGQAPLLGEARPDAPARLRDLVHRLMARNPAARPASAGIARALLTGGSGTARALRNPPLVGRAAAIGALEAAMDAGGTAILVGEVGSGTGRMAAWALNHARSEAFETIAIRCRDRAAPMDPVEQLARDLSRIAGPVAPAAEHLGRALEALAGEGKLLVCVEDADRVSLEAGRILWQAFAAAPDIALVVTCARRPEGLDGHVVELRPLTPEETWRLIAGMLATRSPPAGLAPELHRISSGLPAIIVLAIKELVNKSALRAEGVADDGTARWRLDRRVPMEPTTGLARLFGSVLQELSPESRAIIEVLAVVGESLPLDTALELAKADASGLAADALVLAGLVNREKNYDGDWIMLRRPAVGALVLDQVPASAQTRIHRELADALRSLAPDPWRDEQIAWHAAHGASPDEAPVALATLGQHLNNRGQHARALTVLDRAGEGIAVDTHTTAMLAVTRGEALSALSRRTEAIEALSAGGRLAEDPALEGRALVALAQVHRALGNEKEAAQLANEALELLADLPQDPSLPAALLLAAATQQQAARPDEAHRLFQRCIDVAQGQKATGMIAMAEGGLGGLLAEEGQLEEALEHLSREGSHLRVYGTAHRLVPVLYRIAITLRRLGRPDEALAALDEADDAARFARLPYERARADTGRAAVHLACGDIVGAQELLERRRVAYDPDADSFLRLAYREVEASIRLASGDRQAALAVFHAAESEASQGGFEGTAAFFLGMTGVMTADPDSLVKAMDVLGVAGDRRLAAKVLLLGALTGGDPDILESAEQEARNSGDQFLLLEVLHASGTEINRVEAFTTASAILAHVPRSLRDHFLGMPAVKWSGVKTDGDRPN
jgi:tetratricopeptide (TPR) repeat protein